MGRNQQTWHKEQWQSQGSRHGGWGYWRGSYSPRQRDTRARGKGDGKGKEDRGKDLFPRYDARKADPTSDSTQLIEVTSTSVDTKSDFVGAIQTCINATRKAETRVKNLERAIKQKKSQWTQYEADLRKSYQKEKERMGQSLARLEEDLHAARETEDRAKHVLKSAFTMSRAATSAEAETVAPAADTDWERLTKEIPMAAPESDGALLARIFGEDAAGWGDLLANRDHARAPPGLAGMDRSPGPGEPSEAPGSMDGSLGAYHTEGTKDPFASSPSVAGLRVPGISPAARERRGSSRTSVKTRTPPQLGRTSRLSLGERLAERRAEMIAAGQGPTAPPDPGDAKKENRGSVLVDDDEDPDMTATGAHAEALSAMS